MALGVLNNLSAIYAENNLNNTNNSLQTVLQQLSSGSRINSGADDAAGLSLVNGLQANSSALTQSGTNATEGVGLLEVADGALSQVTNLLNRAITLATEASNGTLNSTQEGAANQEYQSLLAEITNIGSTTTFNQQQVFNGTNVAIYTGDSSTSGSSVDMLNIHALSSSNVGDSGGAMSYTNGQNNVFINLSTGAKNAQSTDSLNGGAAGTTTVDVNYLVTGSNGSSISATAKITVGAGSTGNPANGGGAYANTADGLISAINNSGLGMSASFSTAGAAGGTGNETGIQIAGRVGVGVAPGTVSTGGYLTTLTAGDTLAVGGTFKPTVGGIAGTTVTASAGESLDAFATAIIGANANLNATVVTNGDGSQSLFVSDKTAGSGALTAVTVGLTSTAGTAMIYSGASAYGIGLSSDAANIVEDSSTAQGAASSFITDSNVRGGIATISYSDSSGQALGGTDLTTQANAQIALTDLNLAITDVSAQDGYIGAQINTLNSISQVMSTQKENVVSAQNAIQATDYASATSNMSKYEILSQTGIAALAQANSVQQEVTKLLQ